jgi:hypothetical protein
MLRSRKTLIAGAFAGMALTATLAGTALAGPVDNPNNPAYYGPNCTKVEFVDGTTTYVVPAGVTVYIKAGNVITSYTGPITVTLDKDISFVITCPPTPSPSPSPTYTS